MGKFECGCTLIHIASSPAEKDWKKKGIKNSEDPIPLQLSGYNYFEFLEILQQARTECFRFYIPAKKFNVFLYIIITSIIST